MKRILKLSLVFLLCANSYSQTQRVVSLAEKAKRDSAITKAKEIIKGSFQKYLCDINEQGESVYRTFSDKAGDTFSYDDCTDFFNDIERVRLSLINASNSDKDSVKFSKALAKRGNFNPTMENIFMEKEISSFFNGAEDLSLQRFYANYNTDDKSINIGINTDGNYKNKLDRLNTIFTFGLKIKTSDEFGTVFSQGEFQKENVGLTFKASKIGKGYISYRPLPKGRETITDRVALVKDYRDNILKPKYEAAIKSYLEDGAFQKELDSLASRYEEKFNTVSGFSNALDTLAKSKRLAYYTAIANEEVNYSKKNKLFKSVENHWWSFDLFAPFGRESVNTAVSAESSEIIKNNFYAFNANLSLSYLFKNQDGVSVFVTGGPSLKANNNILAENQSEIAFETFTEQSETQRALTLSEKVFITEYDAFTTFSLKFRSAALFIKEFAGLGLSLEKNFGQYDAFNYQLGIPLVVRDKKGKPTINLELQYRNINNKGSVGFSTSILFGQLIK